MYLKLRNPGLGYVKLRNPSLGHVKPRNPSLGVIEAKGSEPGCFKRRNPSLEYLSKGIIASVLTPLRNPAWGILS